MIHWGLACRLSFSMYFSAKATLHKANTKPKHKMAIKYSFHHYKADKTKGLMRIFRRLIFPVGPAIMPMWALHACIWPCYYIPCFGRKLGKSCPEFLTSQGFCHNSHIVLSENFSLCFRMVIPHPCGVLFLFNRVILRTVSITFFLSPTQGLCTAVLHVLGNIVVEKWSEIDCTDCSLEGQTYWILHISLHLAKTLLRLMLIKHVLE